jgi:PAS domain S-box-containing protein
MIVVDKTPCCFHPISYWYTTARIVIGMIKNVKLSSDQVRKSYEHMVFSSTTTLINGCILVLILRTQIPALKLWLWLAGALSITLTKLMLYRGYCKTAPSHLATIKWKNYFIVSLFFTGILWGTAALFLFPPASIGHQAFIAFVTGGMVAGAVGSYTAVLGAFFFFSIPALLPIIIRFFLLGSEIHMAMGTMTLLFLSIMSLVALRTHKTYVKLLSLRYENSNLVEGLQQEVIQRKRAEEDLHKKNQQIEEIVETRTAELKSAVEQLSEEIQIRQRTQEALRKGDEKYRELVENIKDILFSIDHHGRVTYISPVVESVFDYRPEEVMGKQFYEFVDASDHVRMKNNFEQALQKSLPKTEAREYRFLSKSGRMKWCRTSVRPIEENGKVCGMQGILADITESKLLEEQLHRAQKMEALGTLAGGVAHDLNNILSGIVSYPELLLLDLPQDSPLRKPLATIKAAGEKATAIVQDLLTLSRRGVSATDLLNLNHMINEYLQSPRFKSLRQRYPNIRVKRDLHPALFNLIGSRDHILKTLVNLVTNAAEAMPAGGNITISTTNQYFEDKPAAGFESVTEGEYVMLTVTDAGIGIEEEDLARIFEPFYTKKVTGRGESGLGMAVVWGTVKDHGGFINVKSSKNSGTRFQLFFPATRQPMTQHGNTQPLDLHTYMGNGELILVIDDVEQQREIASKMLIRLNYRPEAADSGEAAIKYFAEKKPDLIILDMIMKPGIDGFETYQELLKINPHQKAIIVSGYSETEQVRKTQALGAGKYIKKPYTIETLAMAIREELKAEAEK